MAVALLVLYGIFIALTVGVRAAIQLRRTGSPGVNRFAGEPGQVEWVAGITFIIGSCAAPLGPILDLLGVLEPIPLLDSSAVNVFGLVLGVVGTLLVFLAQLAMGDSWRIGVETEGRPDLVTTGVFGIVRNPIFAATIPTMLGFALMVPNVFALVDLVVIVTALELQVRVVEEPYLLREHGGPYRSYVARVGRFFPGVGLIKAPAVDA